MRTKVKVSLLGVLFIILSMILIFSILSFDQANIASAESNEATPAAWSEEKYFSSYCMVDNGYVETTLQPVTGTYSNSWVNYWDVIDLKVSSTNDISSYYSANLRRCGTKRRDGSFVTDTNVYNLNVFGSANAFKFKLEFHDSYGFTMSNDSYRGNLNGISNSSAIGKGAIAYREINYDIDGNPTNGSWTVIRNIFSSGNTFVLPITIQKECDLEIISFVELFEDPHNIFKKKVYHNLRNEYYFKFCKEPYLFFDEGDSNKLSKNELFMRYPFRISTNTKYLGNVQYRIDDNPFQSIKPSEMTSRYFNQQGKYQFKFKLYGTGAEQIYNVTLDSEDPCFFVNGLKCYAPYPYYDKNGRSSVYCHGDATITWTTSKRAPTTVQYSKGNSFVSLRNGETIAPGNHTIKVNKHWDFHDVTYTFVVKFDPFLPTQDFEYLRDGGFYSTQANRFSTRLYGVRLIEEGKTNVYCYDTIKEASEKALDYERANYVTVKPDGKYSYRGEIYETESELAAAMNNQIQSYLFQNRDLSLTENIFMEPSLKQNRLYLNGFYFVYKGDQFLGDSARAYRAQNINDQLTEDIKSILRDSKNPNSIDVVFRKSMSEQLSVSGKYFIMEKNIYGEEFFFEAFFSADNDTTAQIEYYDANQILQSAGIDKNNTNSIQTSYLNVKSLFNEIDPFAILKIQNSDTGETRISVVGDTNITLTKVGNYVLTFVDRNNHSFTVNVSIIESPFVLIGVENSGNANNDVTILLSPLSTITFFSINGESKDISIFQLNSETGKYEYTLHRAGQKQEVVVIFTYQEQTISIGFTVSSQ